MVKLLAAAQAAMGHDVAVVFLAAPGTTYEREAVSALVSRRVLVHALDRRRKSKLSTIATDLRLFQFLKQWKPDIVNSHLGASHKAVAISRILQKCNLRSTDRFAHVATVHGAPESCWKGLCGWLNKTVPRIYCSQAALEADRHPPHRYCVIDNGIELQTTDDVGRREDLLDSLGVPQQSKLVVSVGSVRRAKNYVGAIAGVAAARALLADGPPVHYLICGEQSNDMPAASQAVRQFQATDWIHFLGTRQDITAILAHSDCFLNSSYHESFGLAVLEALCAGLPCVLSNIPANLKFAANMPGCYIADANDASLLGAALAKCLGTPLGKDSLQRDRQPHLAAYSIDACARHYLEYYQQLV